MSRSGYVDDYEQLNLYRANVARAIRGKRGQAFLREMAAALDAMPVKALVAGEIVRDSAHVCAIGSVAVARGLDVSKLDVEDGDAVGAAFGISSTLAREIEYENDEQCAGYSDVRRWELMRKWVASNLKRVPATVLDDNATEGLGDEDE